MALIKWLNEFYHFPSTLFLLCGMFNFDFEADFSRSIDWRLILLTQRDLKQHSFSNDDIQQYVSKI